MQIFQGLAPAFIGSLSDESGRRPSYIICFVIYLGANIGLALAQNYPAFLILRMVQSSGSSGTVALAMAVVADIVTTAERGTYVGYAQMGALLGPALGPTIGGVLGEYLGWRAIFWFLTILAGVIFIIFVIVFPETCRKIVGNGSSAPQRWNYSLISYLALRKKRKSGQDDQEQTKLSYKSRPNPLNTIWIILDKECSLLLLYGGILFSGLYMVLSGMPSQFKEQYGFTTIQIGLCYLPTGFGSLTAAVISGRFLDWNFARHAKKIGMEISKTKQQDLSNFPVEAARLQVVLPMTFISAALVIIYGWVMHSRTSLAGPLVLLYFVTFSMSSAFQGLGTLIVDLNRSSAGTATAAMNLVRCWMAAGAVALVVPLSNAIGVGWLSVCVAAVFVLISPVSLVVIRWGPRWRAEKEKKEAAEKLEKVEKKRDLTGSEEGGGQ
jgi:multidrug resistance protein